MGYQTRLQGVANDLATRLRELLDAADDETLKLLRREYKTATGDVKSRIRAIQKLVVALEKARAASFAEAETLVVETGRSVAEIASDATLAEIYPLLNAAERLDAKRSKRRAAEVEERRRRLKPLSAKQIDAILNWSPIQGASIAQWFERWRENDLRRIVDEVQTGAVESLSVYELTRKIRGTKANGYADGILQTSRRSAETVARTVINGVSNEARFATLCENDDVLDGIQFLATLDGRTSFVCASLDGKIWRGDEMEKAARPPLHPNCRSTLIPYIELRDPETGEIIDESEDLRDENGNVVVRALTRAAANADFNKLAEESYNKTAREKGLKKRWDDLSPSTRLKYYYQAQKDYERRTGKPAYRQVSPSTTFRDYFERQPAAFQRAWLGKNRYELYRTGAATFDDLTKPAPTYRVTTGALFQTSDPSGEKRVSTPEPEPKRGKRLSDFGPLRSSANAAPITDAKSFIAAIEERRREVFGEDEAEKLNAQEREYALERVKAAALGRAYWRTKQEYQKAIQGSANQEETLNLFNLLRDQKTRFDKRADALKNKNIARYAVSERAFWLDALFPDVDGASLFSVKERQDLASVFTGRQCDAPALEVLELFDKIGRFIGSDPTTPKPFAQFSPTLGNKSGAYYDDRLMIFIHPEKSASGADFSATFAHEIGHWFEVRVLGYDVADANVDWLREVTSNENAPQVQKQDGEILDLSGCQEVFWSYNYYSAWVYPLRDSPDGKPYRVSEIASTGLEALLTDPEAFARSAPEHFNRILSIIRAARNK